MICSTNEPLQLTDCDFFTLLTLPWLFDFILKVPYFLLGSALLMLA